MTCKIYDFQKQKVLRKRHALKTELETLLDDDLFLRYRLRDFKSKLDQYLTEQELKTAKQ